MPDEGFAAPGKLRMSTSLAGLRIVVSAGPTYEDIDPVRFIGNRSSGKMGFAIAAAAAQRGAQVRLIAGPVHQPTPRDVQRTDVRSAAQMHAAVLSALPADVYIGAAAVADFTPRSFARPSGDTAAASMSFTTPDRSRIAPCASRIPGFSLPASP